MGQWSIFLLTRLLTSERMALVRAVNISENEAQAFAATIFGISAGDTNPGLVFRVT
jgi:hypothetical protein